MILVGLDIENYKQYAGTHRIEPAPNGIVGVLGPNGVGKTTLFEAIEWCLYNPREITTEEVRARGGTGHTRVRVTLEDPRDGVRYVVERVRKAKAISADLYREDQPESRIVTGTRQVTEYVARQLVGLSHRAFVSTFFTRQKELSFFGTLKETDRRREVGRLLGLETIREAQRRISDDRSAARADAQGLQHQAREASDGRDFAAERVAADANVADRKADNAAAVEQVAGAGQALIRTGQDLARWHELERRDNDFALRLERLGGEERTQVAAQSAATDELRRMDAAAATRASLVPIVGDLAIRSQAVEAFATERIRFERTERLRVDAARVDQALVRAGKRLRDLITGTPAGGGIPAAWTWRQDDARDVPGTVARLLGAARALDVATAEQTAAGLASCLQLARDRDQVEKRVQLYRTRLATLKAQEEAILAGGDPHAAAVAARERRDAALAAAQNAGASRAAEAAARGRLERAIGALERFDFHVPCPTCQRPFTAEQADVVLATLTAAVREHATTEARLGAEEEAAGEAARRAEADSAAAEERARALDDARSRVSQGAPMIEEAETLLADSVAACRDAFREAGIAGAPTPEEAADANERAARMRRVAATIPILEQTRGDAATWTEERTSLAEALEEIGVVSYDPDAHAAAQAALDEAGRAAARIGEIDGMLARRPEVEAGLAAAGSRIDALATQRAAVVGERAALGFDVAALDAAQAAQQAAAEAERAAIRRQHLAQGLVGDAERLVTDLEREEARIALLSDRAAQRGRDADELDRMYREFSRFDQWVAEQVTPQLAEHTGELLAAVTEGKYDRVEFDDNYGLRIFDEDESFPIESFSGGERDVAALCARLALSRLVGGQSGHPPEFLVLDEVFGSLDRERRTQLLEMLGTLAASTEAFRQLFIISHVDDVRASAVFNQVWRIQETESGASRVEDITAGGGVEEI